jgi:hypothetical protein
MSKGEQPQALPSKVICDAPGARRGDFCFGDFTHAPSPENLPKNDFCPLKGGSLSDVGRF